MEQKVQQYLDELEKNSYSKKLTNVVYNLNNKEKVKFILSDIDIQDLFLDYVDYLKENLFINGKKRIKKNNFYNLIFSDDNFLNVDYWPKIEFNNKLMKFSEKFFQKIAEKVKGRKNTKIDLDKILSIRNDFKEQYRILRKIFTQKEALFLLQYQHLNKELINYFIEINDDEQYDEFKKDTYEESYKIILDLYVNDGIIDEEEI